MSTEITTTRPNGNGNAMTAAPDDFLTRMACNPDMDAEKLRVVAQVYIDMQEKQRGWLREDAADRARTAFWEAFPAMQNELPVLEKDQKNQEGKGKFVDYGDAWEKCCPVWSRHGFSVSFPDALLTEAGLIRVTCRVAHKAGHVEIFTAPDTPADTTGPKGTINKTIPQGNQATITYVQRGLLFRAIGIATKREDDDGNSGGRSHGYRPADPPDDRGDPDETGSRNTKPGGMAEYAKTISKKRGAPPDKWSKNPLVNEWLERIDHAEQWLDFQRLAEQAFIEATATADVNELDTVIDRFMQAGDAPPATRTSVKDYAAAARKRTLAQERAVQSKAVTAPADDEPPPADPGTSDEQTSDEQGPDDSPPQVDEARQSDEAWLTELLHELETVSASEFDANVGKGGKWTKALRELEARSRDLYDAAYQDLKAARVRLHPKPTVIGGGASS